MIKKSGVSWKSNPTSTASRSLEIGDANRGSQGSPSSTAQQTNHFDHNNIANNDNDGTGTGEIISVDDSNASNINSTIAHSSNGYFMNAISEITEINKEDGGDNHMMKGIITTTTTTTTTTPTSLFSIDINNATSDVIYVAVGESQTSMDALLWTLNNHPPNSLVYLVHIFPPLKFIPGPMGAGKVPLSQVSPESAESYLTQHRSQIRQLIGKYMDKCTAYQVQADTILIESDLVADAILELIYVLDISKLVVGISKSNLRKLKGENGNGKVAHQILHNAPVECEIKIVYQDKEVLSEQGSADAPPNSSSITTTTTTTTTRGSGGAEDNELKPQHSANNNSFSCCFKPNF